MDNINFQTKPEICQYMVSLLPFYNPSYKTVLEPTPGNGNLVASLKQRGYNVVVPKGDFWKMPKGRFDAVVMNPPFSPMAEGYKILFKVMEYSDIVVALMPYLTIINSEKRTGAILEYGLVSVTHLPRTAFKGSRVQTCVLQMKKGFNETTKYFFMDKNYKIIGEKY